MKTAVYQLVNGDIHEIEFDETAPCTDCGEPVIEASMAGTTICPWCDCGRCRYCDVALMAVKEEFDGGRSLRAIKEHMRWHKEHQ